MTVCTKLDRNRRIAYVTFERGLFARWVAITNGPVRTLCGTGVQSVVPVPNSARKLHVSLYRKRARRAQLVIRAQRTTNKPSMGDWAYVHWVIAGNEFHLPFTDSIDDWLFVNVFNKYKIDECFAHVTWS